MAEQDLIAEHTLWRHRAQPVEMRCVELRMRRAGPTIPLFGQPVDQIAVVIAET